MTIALITAALLAAVAAGICAGTYGACGPHNITYLRRAGFGWAGLSVASHALAYLAGAA